MFGNGPQSIQLIWLLCIGPQINSVNYSALHDADQSAHCLPFLPAKIVSCNLHLLPDRENAHSGVSYWLQLPLPHPKTAQALIMYKSHLITSFYLAHDLSCVLSWVFFIFWHLTSMTSSLLSSLSFQVQHSAPCNKTDNVTCTVDLHFVWTSTYIRKIKYSRCWARL